jgi:hypothetical protein
MTIARKAAESNGAHLRFAREHAALDAFQNKVEGPVPPGPYAHVGRQPGEPQFSNPPIAAL